MSRPTTVMSHVPRSTRPSTRATAALSQERLAADVAAFQAAGGRIEVLGNTRTLKRIDPDGSNTPDGAP